jgi:hypothetical protein
MQLLKNSGLSYLDKTELRLEFAQAIRSFNDDPRITKPGFCVELRGRVTDDAMGRDGCFVFSCIKILSVIIMPWRILWGDVSESDAIIVNGSMNPVDFAFIFGGRALLSILRSAMNPFASALFSSRKLEGSAQAKRAFPATKYHSRDKLDRGAA